ncbi:uncharacterized protein Tco025E_08224 [Trypanosoma conorhini]|uniref:Uncharacterized protein n=1 Tax=Trypanosoma conorhini TaxID=83891 RepID=A0A422NDB2_9TRYP|nr:uncharacterized protein Tco025E_08224 [Trypanosoma conorhini]RNF03473.1 hypothetical protein Tco025E_08224 [Trypanosoma conorhini]
MAQREGSSAALVAFIRRLGRRPGGAWEVPRVPPGPGAGDPAQSPPEPRGGKPAERPREEGMRGGALPCFSGAGAASPLAGEKRPRENPACRGPLPHPPVAGS